jgi:hypothetical protein
VQFDADRFGEWRVLVETGETVAARIVRPGRNLVIAGLSRQYAS